MCGRGTGSVLVYLPIKVPKYEQNNLLNTNTTADKTHVKSNKIIFVHTHTVKPLIRRHLSATEKSVHTWEVSSHQRDIYMLNGKIHHKKVSAEERNYCI